MKENNKLKIYTKGLKDGIPVCLGYFAVSFAFGIQASGIGISPLNATLLSLLNVTSAGQLAALDVIAGGGSYFAMALLQLIINLRYMLMSTALSQKLDPSVKKSQRLKMAYGITDEIFALSVIYPDSLPPVYTYGLISIAVPGWTIGTLIGAAAGQILPGRITSALGIAIYGMFVAIVIPEVKNNRSVLYAVIVTMALSTLLVYCPGLDLIPSEYRIILVTVVISAAAALLFPIDDEPDGNALASDTAANTSDGGEA